MKTKVFLIATRKGVMRLTKTPPRLSRDEIGVSLTITIPDEAFRSPLISATLDVAEGSVMQPEIIVEMEVQP